MLEHKDAAALGNHIDALAHVPRIESCRTALEWFLAILAFGVVEVQMQSEVRSFGAVWRFIGAITMR